MKRAKKLVALVTIVSLTLSTMGVVFAADTAAATTYPDLSVSSKTFANEDIEALGTYPVFDDDHYSDLNQSIADSVALDYRYFKRSEDNAGLEYQANDYNVSYTVENHDRYAKVVVTCHFVIATDDNDVRNVVHAYYFDKSTNSVMTEADYTAALAAVDAATSAAALGTSDEAVVADDATTDEKAADSDASDIVMVPLRATADDLGFTVAWDNDTKTCFLTKGNFSTSVVEDKDEYTIDGKTAALGAAPTRNDQDGLTVPTTFFEKVLGATVATDADGNITISVDEK